MFNLTVLWQDRWQWWHRMYPSAYAKGRIVGESFMVDQIYRHKQSGQIRLYSGVNMDGEKLSVNGEPPVTLRPRGRFGKLYLGLREG